jgi:hypothetical protein
VSRPKRMLSQSTVRHQHDTARIVGLVEQPFLNGRGRMRIEQNDTGFLVAVAGAPNRTEPYDRRRSLCCCRSLPPANAPAVPRNAAHPRRHRGVVTFLIDECLSVDLVAIAGQSGQQAWHVAHVGRRAGCKHCNQCSACPSSGPSRPRRGKRDTSIPDSRCPLRVDSR